MELQSRMDKHSEKFNSEIWSIRKCEIEVTELKNTIAEVKNTLEGFDSNLGRVEEWISKLKDKAMDLTQTEQQKEKKNLKNCRQLKEPAGQQQAE